MAGSEMKFATLALLLALLGCVARTCEASYGFLPPPAPSLTYGHHPKAKNTCYGAEMIVSNIVKEEVNRDRGIGAGLIRLLFHDCFVQVCICPELHTLHTCRSLACMFAI